MRQFLFNLAIVALMAIAMPTKASANLKWRLDSLPEGVSRYDIRVDRYKNVYSKLIPHYAKLQFAGSIGMFSTGLGWDYGKNHRWETDVLIGIVPRLESNRAKLTFTLRQNIIPWTIRMGESAIDFHPLRASVGLNAIIGHEFWNSNPDRYPDGYYFFSTKFHIVAGFGQQWTLNISRDKMRHWKNIGFYYNLTTCETYVLSAASNKYLGFFDIFKLDLGLKLQIL